MGDAAPSESCSGAWKHQRRHLRAGAAAEATARMLAANIISMTQDVQAVAALAGPLEAASGKVLATFNAKGKLMLCGNGGSASDATHLATEFLCRFDRDRQPYPAISLSANGDYLTAVCNDYHADEIFARQIWGLTRPWDCLIVFSTSGQSRNIVRALEEAQRLKLWSIAFLGRDGGACKGLATVELIVPGATTARIQELHQFLFHQLCEVVETRL